MVRDGMEPQGREQLAGSFFLCLFGIVPNQIQAIPNALCFIKTI